MARRKRRAAPEWITLVVNLVRLAVILVPIVKPWF